MPPFDEQVRCRDHAAAAGGDDRRIVARPDEQLLPSVEPRRKRVDQPELTEIIDCAGWHASLPTPWS
jgi:hypothetical protein